MNIVTWVEKQILNMMCFLFYYFLFFIFEKVTKENVGENTELSDSLQRAASASC